MSENENLVPKRRFKEFKNTGTWEQRKLGEHVTIKSGWSPSNFVRTNSEGSELFIKVDDLNYSSREQNDSQMRVYDNPRFQKMKKGSTIFPKRGAAIMTNKVRILSSDAYMDTNMMALEPQEIDGDFLYTFIDRTGLYKIADTSTIPQINNKHIEPYIIYCPSVEEQTKVGSIFKKLDDTIALHQRQLDNYKELKKAMLQKIFNQELRFKNDDGNDYPDWREVILEEICLYKSSNISLDSFKEYNGEEIYPLYDANSLVLNIDKYDQENEYVSIIKDGAGVGRIRYCEGKSSVLGTMGYLLPTDTVDIKFLYFRLQIINFLSYVSGSTIPHIYFKDYKKENIGLPCEDEQKKIADVLSALDIKIEISVQKIEALKQQKKGFMQQMFV